ERAGPAILRWAVDGCLAWQRDGLDVPDVVETSTAEYRATQDPIGDFLADCCVLDPGAWVTAAALWAAYEGWAKGNGEPVASRRRLSGRIEQAGCKQDRKTV